MNKLLILLLILLSPIFGQQKTTETGIKLIKYFEGFRSKTYYCPAGVLTVGYGSTGKHVKPGMVITEKEATILLIEDVKRFEEYLRKRAGIIKWNEFDALISFTFNVGYRINEDIQKAIKTGNSNLVVYYLSKYNKAKVSGTYKVLPGLVYRRTVEGKLYKDAVIIIKN